MASPQPARSVIRPVPPRSLVSAAARGVLLVWFFGLASGAAACQEPAEGASAGAPSVLWQIGELDDRARELALGEKEEYIRFPERFPEDPVFRVGSSSPGRDWPYIHPGPKDVWAGSRSHAFTVLFELEEPSDGTHVLLVDLVRSHETFPPELSVELNGREAGRLGTERAGGNQEKYILLPEVLLRKGQNRLRIVNPDGSWVIYDGLRLERFPPGVPIERLSAIRLRDTILFREIDGKLHQIAHVAVDGPWDERGTFLLKGPDGTIECDAGASRLRAGLHEIPIPVLTAPVPYVLELVTPRRTVSSGEINVLLPHRRWTVYAVLKTHYDLGYTHPLDEMLRNAAGPMLDAILAHVEETREYPEGARFRWVYPTWVLGRIRGMLSGERAETLDAAIRRGDIGWNAAPFTLHSYFCGLEDMVRAFYPSARLEERYGRTVGWAKQTDVPGHTRFLPQALARSGVRLLQIGANFGVRGQSMPYLFWWEAPDGSRVLTQFTAGYGWGYDENRLRQLEGDPSYPWDAYLALHVTGDNVGPGDLVGVAHRARELSERYAYPRIVIGDPEGFVDAVEGRFADRIPVVRTEQTDWWIHGVASMAREVSLARRARERLTAAEKLWSLARIAGSRDAYPAETFARAYEESLLFSEHTWGMAGFKPEPRPRESGDLETNESEGYRRMRRSWEVKGDEARAAWTLAEGAAREGLRALGEAAGVPRGAVLVFNPLNWSRTDLVRIPLARSEGSTPAGTPDGGPPRALLGPSGEAVPFQVDGDEIVFLTRDVPGGGYAVYAFDGAGGEKGPGAMPPTTADVRRSPAAAGAEARLENARYRIVCDPALGAVRSIVCKESGKELVDPDAPFLLGQYVYEGMEKVEGAGWHGSPYKGPGTGRLVPRGMVSRIEEGPLWVRFVAEGSLPIEGFPFEIGSVDRVVQTVTLPRDLDWIECEVALFGKRPTALVEQGNVAFPLRVEGGELRLELLGSVVDPERDLQELGNRDSFAVQHWVDVSGPEGPGARGVTWSPVDTTIVTLGDLRLFRWDGAYVPGNTRIYANALNNGWSTNFQEWQGGDFRFRFRLRAHAGGWVEGGAARFGRETAQPLLAERVGLPPPAGEGSPGESSPGEGPPGGGSAGEGAAASGAAGPAGGARQARVPPRVRVDARHVVWINLKRAEDGDGYILRLFNPAPEADAARVAVAGRPIASAERVLANERPLAADPPATGPGGAGEPRAALDASGDAVTVPVGPFAIETVRLRLGARF